jgi:nucleosome binding factor SPN SPT16 subunit
MYQETMAKHPLFCSQGKQHSPHFSVLGFVFPATMMVLALNVIMIVLFRPKANALKIALWVPLGA